MVAKDLGIAAMMLGAGRKTKEDAIDYAVGIKLHKKVGDAVQEGDTLLTIYSNQKDIEDVIERIEQSITIGESGEEPVLIHEMITE